MNWSAPRQIRFCACTKMSMNRGVFAAFTRSSHFSRAMYEEDPGDEVELTCDILIERRHPNIIGILAGSLSLREPARRLGSRLRRSPLAIRDRLVGKSRLDTAVTIDVLLHDTSGFMRPLRTKIPLFDSAKTIVLTDVKCIN